MPSEPSLFLLQQVEVGIDTWAWRFRCPDCHRWRLLTVEEFHGLRAVQCGCGLHERFDFLRGLLSAPPLKT